MMKKMTVATASFFLVAALDVAATPVEYNRIVLEVVGDPPNEQLVVNKDDTQVRKCRKNPQAGCVEVSKGHFSEFAIKLRQGVNDCDANDRKWGISKVLLGGEVNGDDPGSKPPKWGALSPDAATDFNADETTGEVKLIRRGNDRVVFYDTNRSEYSLWYTVVAELCGDGRTIELDPSITNKGQ